MNSETTTAAAPHKKPRPGAVPHRQSDTSPLRIQGGLFKIPLDVILLNGLTCGSVSCRSWSDIVLNKPQAERYRELLQPASVLGDMTGAPNFHWKYDSSTYPDEYYKRSAQPSPPGPSEQHALLVGARADAAAARRRNTTGQGLARSLLTTAAKEHPQCQVPAAAQAVLAQFTAGLAETLDTKETA